MRRDAPVRPACHRAVTQLENLLDPAHLPFAHHGVLVRRVGACSRLALMPAASPCLTRLTQAPRHLRLESAGQPLQAGGARHVERHRRARGDPGGRLHRHQARASQGYHHLCLQAALQHQVSRQCGMCVELHMWYSRDWHAGDVCKARTAVLQPCTCRAKPEPGVRARLRRACPFAVRATAVPCSYKLQPPGKERFNMLQLMIVPSKPGHCVMYGNSPITLAFVSAVLQACTQRKLGLVAMPHAPFSQCTAAPTLVRLSGQPVCGFCSPASSRLVVLARCVCCCALSCPSPSARCSSGRARRGPAWHTTT